MKLRNKSDSKIITLGGVSILPGEVGEVPAGFERNPLLKILPVEVVKEKAGKAASAGSAETADEIAVIIAKLKNSPESSVRKLCEKYGMEVPEGTKLPEMKQLLIDKLTEAGDDDGGEGTSAESAET